MAFRAAVLTTRPPWAEGSTFAAFRWVMIQALFDVYDARNRAVHEGDAQSTASDDLFEERLASVVSGIRRTLWHNARVYDMDTPADILAWVEELDPQGMVIQLE